MISDAWARRTAAEWHAGQASALHMLASSGATHDARHGPATLLEEIAAGSGHVDAAMLTGGDRRALADLTAYVTAVGPRGPEQGWADLPWPSSEDPWVSAYTAAGAALHAGGWALTGSTHPQADWLDFTDTWAAALTHHGHPVAVVRGPDGGPGAWAQVDHRLWTQVDPALARGFITAAGQAGTDVRAALTGLAHIESLHLAELTGGPVTATFLYEGYRDWVAAHDPHQQRVLAVGGAIEQAQLMARYAPVVDTAAALALAEDPQGRDRPGVLEYEVINPVGQWLAEQSAGGPPGTDGLPATLTAAAANTRTLTQEFLATTTPPPRRATPGGVAAAQQADQARVGTWRAATGHGFTAEQIATLDGRTTAAQVHTALTTGAPVGDQLAPPRGSALDPIRAALAEMTSDGRATAVDPPARRATPPTTQATAPTAAPPAPGSAGRRR